MPPRRLGPGGVLFACLFAAQAALLVLSPILPQVADEFGVSNAAAAQLRSVSGMTAGFAALYLALHGERFRLTGLLTKGLLLLAAGSAVSAASPNFPMLLAAQLLIGVGLAMVLSGGLAASEAWAEDDCAAARALSWALIGQPVAWIVGQPVAGAVAATEWRWAWVAVPLASSLVALAAVRAAHPSDREAFECDPAGLWKLEGVKPWVLGELAAFSAWAGTLVYAGAFFIETYHIGVGGTGLLLGGVAAAYLPGNFLGRRRLGTNPHAVLVGSAVALSIWVALFGAYRPGFVFSALALALLAFFAGGRTIAGAAVGLGLARGRRLAAMSVRTAVLQFGYLIGTALGGLVLPAAGFTGLGLTFAALFAFSAAMNLAGRLQRGPVGTGPLRRGGG